MFDITPDESGFIPVLAEALPPPRKEEPPPKEGAVVVSLRLMQSISEAKIIDEDQLLRDVAKLCGVEDEHFQRVEFASNGDTTMTHLNIFAYEGRSAGNVANKLKRRVLDDDLMRSFKYKFDPKYYNRTDNETQPSEDREFREERKHSPPREKPKRRSPSPQVSQKREEEHKEKVKDKRRRRRRRSRSKDRKRSRSPRKSRSRDRKRRKKSRSQDRRTRKSRSRDRGRRRRNKRERKD